MNRCRGGITHSKRVRRMRNWGLNPGLRLLSPRPQMSCRNFLHPMPAPKPKWYVDVNSHSLPAAESPAFNPCGKERSVAKHFSPLREGCPPSGRGRVLKEGKGRACPQGDGRLKACLHPGGGRTHPWCAWKRPRPSFLQTRVHTPSKLFKTPRSGLGRILMTSTQRGGAGWEDAEPRAVGAVQNFFS